MGESCLILFKMELYQIYGSETELVHRKKGAAKPSNFLANGSFNVSHSPFRVCVSRSCPADINPANLPPV